MRFEDFARQAPKKMGGWFLQGFGFLLGTLAFLFLALFLYAVSARTLSLRRSAEGALCGQFSVTRPWGTSTRELSPGSVLGIKSVSETRTRTLTTSGGRGNPSSSSFVTVRVEVLVVNTTGEDIRFDYPDAAAYARSVLASPPGGPVRRAETSYPWVVIPATLAGMALGALFFWLGRREARRSEVPPPA